ARQAEWLAADVIAVGTYREVADVERRFSGDVMVLEPWRPFHRASDSERIIHTVGRLDDLAALGASGRRPRAVLESLTSLRRHGLSAAELKEALASHPGVRVEGLALHLPLGGGHVEEVDSWLRIA